MTMRGVRTPDDVRIAFAAEYLRTGSPRQASLKVDLPERTGWDLAFELDEDPAFAARRAALHARVLDRAEAAVIRSIDILSERIENATEILGGDDDNAPMKVVDKAADYGRSIAALNDSLLKRRKLEDDVAHREREKANVAEGSGTLEVTILTKPKVEAPPDGAS